MKDKLDALKPKLLIVEKSIFFRAFAPLGFLVALIANIYAKVRYSALEKEFIDAVIQDVTYGTNFEKITGDRVFPEMRFTQALDLGTTITLVMIGIVLSIWAAWAVSNFAEKKGFNKRQYFWLSIVIGPVIPLIIASASKETPASPQG